MKKNTIFAIAYLAFTVLAIGQESVTEIKFTAINNTDYIQLDSIKVMNRTQGTDTLLYWPDTLLVLNEQTGIYNDIKWEGDFYVVQNFPNPVHDQTNIIVHIPERNTVQLKITDSNGRLVLQKEMTLDDGFHQFVFKPGSGSYSIFAAGWQNEIQAIKILHPARTSPQSAMLEYQGRLNSDERLKTAKEVKTFGFEAGDQLLYIGFHNIGESGILDSPSENKTVIFQFATNIPCPGIPTVTYEGQTYNTIQIFSQCWLKENLNAGEMISSTQDMTNNGVIEKYCLSNNPSNCEIYGGLYQWNEAMQYSQLEGAQGICPEGWHIPTGEEMFILTSATDSQISIGSPGSYDSGLNLKSTEGWHGSGNGTDLFGFSSWPAGSRDYDGYFYGDTYFTNFWSSLEFDFKKADYYAFKLYLSHDSNTSYHTITYKYIGASVRCIKTQ
jgi:uncharacterized protein (TIGR02145 family)